MKHTTTPGRAVPAPVANTAEDDYEFEGEARAHVAKHPASRAPNTAWIDPDPSWVPGGSWLDSLHHLIKPPSELSERWRTRWRFSLPGGHEIDTLLVNFAGWSHCSDWYTQIESIRVTVNDAQGLKRHYAGMIEDATRGCEMQQWCVTGLPADIAERVAALIRNVHKQFRTPFLWGDAPPEEKAEFLAVVWPHVADRSRCCSCGRTLSDEVSKALGIGPDCAAAVGIPHTQAAAHRALRLGERGPC